MALWDQLFLTLWFLAVVVLIFRVLTALRLFFQFRGQRLVTCPETRKPAAVSVAAGLAASRALFREWPLQLKQCSRWPEREDCGQYCLSQVEAAPQDCLVWTIVSRWYEGRKCAYCGKPFGKIHHLDRRPAFLNREGKTQQWDQVLPEQLPEIFANCRPVCYSCHIAQTFRREYADLVVDRPRWERGAGGEIICHPLEDEKLEDELSH